MEEQRSSSGLKVVLTVTAVVVSGVVAVVWLASSVTSKPVAHGAAESVRTLSEEPAAGRPAESGSLGAAPAPPLRETTKSPEVAEVEATIRAWARAWSSQSVEDYLEFYSVGFEPADGTPLSEWRQQRYPRLRNPQRIRVALGAIAVRMASPELAIASFEQSYESDVYRDRCRKTLELVLEDGAWVIERELAEEL